MVAAAGVGPGTSGGSGLRRNAEFLVETLVYLPLLGLDKLDSRLAEMCGRKSVV